MAKQTKNLFERSSQLPQLEAAAFLQQSLCARQLLRMEMNTLLCATHTAIAAISTGTMASFWKTTTSYCGPTRDMYFNSCQRKCLQARVESFTFSQKTTINWCHDQTQKSYRLLTRPCTSRPWIAVTAVISLCRKMNANAQNRRSQWLCEQDNDKIQDTRCV